MAKIIKARRIRTGFSTVMVIDCPALRVWPEEGTVMNAPCAKAEATREHRTKNDFIFKDSIKYLKRRI